MINNAISINIHYRPQLLVGLTLGIWLYFFLVLIGPFDAVDLPMNLRTLLMLGYGVIFFLNYALLIPVQNKLYSHWGGWKLGHEIALVGLFCLYSLPTSFAYYKTGIMNGTFSFDHFALIVYLPIIILLVPVIFLGRYLVSRDKSVSMKDAIQEEQKGTVILRGDNKLDILKLPMSDLVAVEAANNYVAVYYLLNGQLQKKLLRNSLRKIQKTVPEMIQVHRSYLVNAQHFVAWKDGLSLVLTQLNVPVSQKYKSTLLNMSAFAPK